MSVGDDVESWVSARVEPLLRYAYLLTGDRHAAEDLVQDALATVVEKWDRIGRTDDPDRYVRRMIANGRVSAWRRTGRRLVPIADVEQASVPDLAPGVVRRDVVWQVCRGLPPKQRAAVVLRFYEGLDDVAIADILDCSVSTVRSQIHRALAAMRAELTADGVSHD